MELYQNSEVVVKRRRPWLRWLRNLAAIVLIFSLGFAVGDNRLNIPWQQHRHQTSNLPARLDYDSVNTIYRSLKDNYDGKLTESQLEDGLKHGLAAATHDPYTVYFTAKEAQEFEGQVNNHFSGIGAQLGQDKDGNLEVSSPIEGLPAAKAGLKAKDIIASINGQPTTGMSIDEAISKIRGPKGSKVKLQIVRERKQVFTVTITRDDIKIPSVKTKILDGNIGYLELTDFANDTANLTQKAATDFKSKNVRGVILDLRNNGGGYLDAAVQISGLWLPEGRKIIDEKGGGVSDSKYSTGNDVLHGVPTVVLINEGSASAAEITAGALHDNKTAYLIGAKTYGKGVVQQLINFGDGSQLKVTVASWYRPNGQNINKKGITPDKTVKLTEADVKAAHDTQLEAAQAYLNK